MTVRLRDILSSSLTPDFGSNRPEVPPPLFFVIGRGRGARSPAKLSNTVNVAVPVLPYNGRDGKNPRCQGFKGGDLRPVSKYYPSLDGVDRTQRRFGAFRFPLMTHTP